MTLPSSGTLSLNAIHIEAGGSNATSCSINDSDIRGLIGKSSGASMSFNEWYGASSFTPETVIDITPAISGMKYSVPDFRTYTLTFSSTGSIIHDNTITLTSGATRYIHMAGGSSIVSTGTVMYSSSSSPTGGGGTATYLNGKYWRIPNSYNDGTNINNTGNYLISGGASHTVSDPLVSGNPTVFNGFRADVATGFPCGQLVKRITINVY